MNKNYAILFAIGAGILSGALLSHPLAPEALFQLLFGSFFSTLIIYLLAFSYGSTSAAAAALLSSLIVSMTVGFLPAVLTFIFLLAPAVLFVDLMRFPPDIFSNNPGKRPRIDLSGYIMCWIAGLGSLVICTAFILFLDFYTLEEQLAALMKQQESSMMLKRVYTAHDAVIILPSIAVMFWMLLHLPCLYLANLISSLWGSQILSRTYPLIIPYEASIVLIFTFFLYFFVPGNSAAFLSSYTQAICAAFYLVHSLVGIATLLDWLAVKRARRLVAGIIFIFFFFVIPFLSIFLVFLVILDHFFDFRNLEKKGNL